MNRGFSVRIHLTSGSTDGLQHVTKSNWTGLGLSCSRAEFKNVQKRPEFGNSGIYILIGTNEDGTDEIYIGEAESLGNRIAQHAKNEQKEFWTRFVAFTTSDNSLNKAHVRFLESKLILAAKKAAKAKIHNATSSPETNLMSWEEDDLNSFLDSLSLLLPIMGVHVFVRDEATPNDSTYHIDSKGVKASGQYQSAGFLVTEGSTAVAPENQAPSFAALSRRKLRDKLIEDGVLAKEGKSLTFTRDYLFSAPSAASSVILGRATNGWTTWKDLQGKSLDENEREAVES